MSIGELFKTADWKSEKHVPVIECEDRVPSGELFDLKVSLGKEVAHPNTTAHHIRWIRVYYKPQGAKSVYEVGSFEFTAHGASTEGADTGPVYTNHNATCSLKVTKPGTILATAYCNIHGLWENSKEIELR
ncbi:MAG: class II SORL domain-containing protein [Desulfohalobiaceae bacterium]|nr:class II SORL domain-containing protein [Desulfohalobiaceae bacterium]